MDYRFEIPRRDASFLLDGTDSGAGRESFGVELMHRIDHELINVCRQGLYLTNALRSARSEELYQKLNQYKEAVSSYIAFVGENLYRFFHHVLRAHPLYIDFLEFEAETQKIVERVSVFLKHSERSIFSHKHLLERAVYRLDTILVERHEEEIEFLSPLLRRVEMSQAIPCLSPVQNRVLFL